VFVAAAFLVSRSEYVWLMLWDRVNRAPLQFTGLVLLAAVLLDLLAPQVGSRIFGPIERFGGRLARRKRVAILAVAAAAILIRLALLPIEPVPVPEIHDEFSYLLAADTFAHGRLANPPHRLSIYLDTFHVNMHPMYMSMYPPAQGAVLAIGQLLGQPWIGVLLSVAAMCAAMVWALQGWLPPQWAFLGGMLVLLQIGISSYWINSYWGGAVAATGGALVIGALPRIMHTHRPLYAVILGLGVAILANSRPYEGAIFCMPVFACLLFWFWKRRSDWRNMLLKAGVPIVVVLSACGGFMLYYNAHLTGNCLLLPEALDARTHYSTPLTIFQEPRPPLHFDNPQFEAFYNDWVPNNSWHGGQPRAFKDLLARAASDCNILATFFVWPAFWPLLVGFPLALREWSARFSAIQMGLGFGGFLTVAWFESHYAAPLTIALVLLLVQSMRHVRRWRFSGRPIGAGFSRAIVLCALVFAPVHAFNTNREPAVGERAKIAAELSALPGYQLVIVRYFARHDPNQEWVYNRADIDHSKIVWAREIPGVSMKPLLDYFRGRHVWLVTPDSNPAKLFPYDPSQQGNESSTSGG
jgi:hypothetical protein